MINQQRLFRNTAQEKLDTLETLPDGEVIERAWTELSALCGAGVPHKNWTMSVPVDADRDSDIIFGEVLKRFAKAIDYEKRT